jgi:hypothetical protein
VYLCVDCCCSMAGEEITLRGQYYEAEESS